MNFPETRFKLIERSVLLGSSQIPNDIYEWQLHEPKKFGKLTLHFVVPLDGAPRRFYLQPILQTSLKSQDTNAFISTACNHGYKLLHSLEGHGNVEQLAHKLYAALF